MLNKKKCEELLDECLVTGADFAELFIEEKRNIGYNLNDSKVQRIRSLIRSGIGIRICLKNETVYGYTNSQDKNEILLLIKKLRSAFDEDEKITEVSLKEIKYENKHKIEIPFDKVSAARKVSYLKLADKTIREKSKLVNQVIADISESIQNVTIANSDGRYIKDVRNLLNFGITAFGKKGKETDSIFDRFRVSAGYEILSEEKIITLCNHIVDELLELLDAGYFEGGTFPVIIGNGWGGVLIHEACGHSFESNSLLRNETVFKDKLNKKVANPIVNIIDDATLENYWGSTNVDDEGNICQKNVLVENGILKQFLIDNRAGIELNLKPIACCRRESYKYKPTARMNNTYVAPGTDKIEDMIKSIDYGIYVKILSGGSVHPATGEFNFGVKYGNVIRNGKICEAIKGASLIGHGEEVLKNICMISDDLEFNSGMCGASSGSIPNCCGQPTLKISQMTIGGRKEVK